MNSIAFALLDHSCHTPRGDQGRRTGLLDSSAANVCVIEANGIIIKVNKAWLRFAELNGCPSREAIGVGCDYLKVCAGAASAGDPFAEQALEGIISVIRGWRRDFVLEYPCHAPDLQRWFRMMVTPVRHRSRFIIAHEPIAIPNPS